MPALAKPFLAPGSLAARDQPVLAADGLTMRPWKDTDAPAVSAAYDDPKIQYWHARSMTPQEALDWVRSWQQTLGTGDRSRMGHHRGDRAPRADQPPHHRPGRGARRRRLLGPGSSTRPRRRDPSRTTAQQVEPGRPGPAQSGAGALHPEPCLLPSRRNSGFALEGTKRRQALHGDGWHDMHLHALLAEDPTSPAATSPVVERPLPHTAGR